MGGSFSLPVANTPINDRLQLQRSTLHYYYRCSVSRIIRIIIKRRLHYTWTCVLTRVNNKYRRDDAFSIVFCRQHVQWPCTEDILRDSSRTTYRTKKIGPMSQLQRGHWSRGQTQGRFGGSLPLARRNIGQIFKNRLQIIIVIYKSSHEIYKWKID